MKRALVSVTNKEGIVEFCQGLEKLDFEIVSTGGTLKKLQEVDSHRQNYIHKPNRLGLVSFLQFS